MVKPNKPVKRPQKPGTNQQIIKAVIRKFSGQENVLTIPRPYVDLVGDIKGALLLSQCVYWSDRGHNPDGWFWKSHEEWWDEIGLSEHDIRTWAGSSTRPGKLGLWLEVKRKRAQGKVVTHYRVRMDKLLESLETYFEALEARRLEELQTSGDIDSGTYQTQDPESEDFTDSGTYQTQGPESEDFTGSIPREYRNWIVRESPIRHAGEPAKSSGSYTESTSTTQKNRTVSYLIVLDPVAASADQDTTARSADEIWETTLGQLQMQMTRATYDTWVKHSRGLAYEEGTFVVGVPSGYAKDWLENRLHTTIKRTLESMLGQKVEVRYVVWSRPPAEPARYRVGQRVRHPSFGDGVVAEVLMPDGAESVRVTFDRGETRWFEAI